MSGFTNLFWKSVHLFYPCLSFHGIHTWGHTPPPNTHRHTQIHIHRHTPPYKHTHLANSLIAAWMGGRGREEMEYWGKKKHTYFKIPFFPICQGPCIAITGALVKEGQGMSNLRFQMFSPFLCLGPFFCLSSCSGQFHNNIVSRVQRSYDMRYWKYLTYFRFFKGMKITVTDHFLDTGCSFSRVPF